MSSSPGRHARLEALAHLVTAVVTPLALVATVATIWITTCTSNRQLKLSAATFQGSLIYNAMKDARETAALYHEGKASEQDIFAIMQSIYLQHDLGNIVGNAWEMVNKDFCVVLQDDHLSNAWAQENKKRYAESFVSYVSNLIAHRNDVCGRTGP